MIQRFRTAVVALGGNVLDTTGQKTEQEQVETARRAIATIIEGLGRHCALLLVHGNGPQVGAALLRSELAADRLPLLSLASHVAETQGSIGYHLELALRAALRDNEDPREVATLVSLVRVDADDPALEKPSKPVGPYYSEERARTLAETFGWHVVEDAGRGWRRVVASPRPLGLVNAKILTHLVRENTAVIAGGGGGIPVVGRDGVWEPVDGVIDKDRTAMLVGEAVDADVWVCLTGVDAVYLDFGTSQQRRLDRMGVEEARRHLADGQFPPGSMGPKVEAAVRFVEKTGGTALITSSSAFADALEGSAGTIIESPEILRQTARDA